MNHAEIFPFYSLTIDDDKQGPEHEMDGELHLNPAAACCFLLISDRRKSAVYIQFELQCLCAQRSCALLLIVFLCWFHCSVFTCATEGSHEMLG